MRSKIQLTLPGLVVFTLGIGGLAHADTLSFSESLTNGTQSATALFTFDDGNDTLTVTLSNTMTTNGGPQWLTGLFWNLAGAGGLNITLLDDLDSRVDGHHSMITLSGTTQTDYSDADEGHFWAYRDDLSSGDYGSFLDSAFGGTTRQYGLGAAGFDVFGESDVLNFQGTPIPQPDGTDGGILADIAGLQVPGGHEGTPFALHSLEFTWDLDDAGNDFMLSNFGDLAVTDIAFVFGTGFDEVVLIPLPPAVWAGAVGLVGVVALRRRIRLT